MKSEQIIKESIVKISQLIETGNLDQAYNNCISLLQEHSKEPKPILKLAEIHEIKGDISQAQELFIKLEQQNPKNLFVANKCMSFYLRQKKYAKAKYFLDVANQKKYKKLRPKKLVKRMSIVFNAKTQNHKDNVVLTKKYI